MIEFVCTGNQGRSPVAELVGQNYLLKQKLDYGTRSSGTLVALSKTGAIPLSVQSSIVDLGIERKIYSPSKCSDYKIALNQENLAFVTSLFNEAVSYFANEELHHREQVLKKFNIKGQVKSKQDQTIVHADALAVFSMAESNNKQVISIYDNISEKPLISSLASFVTGNPDDTIPNAYGLGLKEYEKAVEQICYFVPKALDKLVK